MIAGTEAGAGGARTGEPGTKEGATVIAGVDTVRAV